MSALGHSLQTHSARVPIYVRYASDSDQIADEAGCRAISAYLIVRGPP
jgi:hypothetical protein